MLYDEFREIKKEFFALLENSIFIDKAETIIAKELESLSLWNSKASYNTIDISKLLVHELFLYTIAYFLKTENYVAAGYLLGHTYFNPSKYRNEKNVSGFDIFYAGQVEILDWAMNDRDYPEGKSKYHSGSAAYWIQNLEIDYFSKEQLVLADLVCYNYSVYATNTLLDWKWFPLTYVYDNRYDSSLKSIANRMISAEFLENVTPLFGFDSKEKFIERCKIVETDKKNGLYRRFSYPECFDEPHLIADFILADQLGTVR